MVVGLQNRKEGTEGPNRRPDGRVALGINGGVRDGLAARFRSNPPLDDRIQALNEKRYG